MLQWFMYWSSTQWQRHATTTIHGNHNDTLHGNRCEYYHDGNRNTCIPAGTIYHDDLPRHDTTATVAVCIPAGTSNDTLHATRDDLPQPQPQRATTATARRSTTTATATSNDGNRATIPRHATRQRATTATARQYHATRDDLQPLPCGTTPRFDRVFIQ